MGIIPLGLNIRLPDLASGKLRLRAGEIVSVNVIKHVSSSVWAVGVKGLVFRATTGLVLTAGETLRALVVRNGAHLELKLVDPGKTPLETTLQAAGFSRDSLTMLAVSALVTWRVKIDEAVVDNLRRVLGKLKGDPKRNARALALLVAKGISPGAGELPALAALYDYGAGGERREPHREKKRKSGSPPPPGEKIVEQLKDAVVTPASRRPGLLALFNHLLPPDGGAHWMVVPFIIGEPESGVSGTLRLLYDAVSRRIKKTIIVTYTPGGERFQFSLIPSPEGFRLSVASDQDRYIGAPLSRWEEHLEPLRRAGVRIAKRIERDGDDGFEPEDGGGEYRHIDLEG